MPVQSADRGVCQAAAPAGRSEIALRSTTPPRAPTPEAGRADRQPAPRRSPDSTPRASLLSGLLSDLSSGLPCVIRKFAAPRDCSSGGRLEPLHEPAYRALVPRTRVPFPFAHATRAPLPPEDTPRSMLEYSAPPEYRREM